MANSPVNTDFTSNERCADCGAPRSEHDETFVAPGRYVSERNRHVATLREVARDGTVELGSFKAALRWAVKRLEGLPEHWRIADSPDETTALLALAEKWEGQIAVAYNEYSHGERHGLEMAAAELRAALGSPVKASECQHLNARPGHFCPHCNELITGR